MAVINGDDGAKTPLDEYRQKEKGDDTVILQELPSRIDDLGCYALNGIAAGESILPSDELVPGDPSPEWLCRLPKPLDRLLKYGLGARPFSALQDRNPIRAY